MEDLSLHILDIVENSVRAEAKLVKIVIVEDEEKDIVALQISDNGKGMDQDTMRRATDPFFTTKQGKRHGMGLALLAQATREANGSFNVSSTPQTGTEIRATFQYNHPDRKPLGDISATLQTLVVGNRDVDFLYEHRTSGEVNRFDTRKVGKL